MLERPARDKHSWLVQAFVNYSFVTLDSDVIKNWPNLYHYTHIPDYGNTVGRVTTSKKFYSVGH